jgi:hypothetical protein
MKTYLIVVFTLLSLSLKSQYFIERSQIRFYMDGELLTKEYADSIPVLIRMNNEVLSLKNTLYLGNDGDVRVSFHFIIEERAISFKNIPLRYFFDTLGIESPRIYEFYYTHIEKLEHATEYNTADYKDYSRKGRKALYKEPIIGGSWSLFPIKVYGRTIPKEVLYYGVARLKHSATSLSSIYRQYDYKLGNDHEIFGKRP